MSGSRNHDAVSLRLLSRAQEEDEEREDEAREDEDVPALADAADQQALPQSLTLQRALDPSVTRGAAWAADGAAAAALAAAEDEEPLGSGPDTRLRPLRLGARGGAAGGVISRRGSPSALKIAAATGTRSSATGAAGTGASIGERVDDAVRWRDGSHG
jgi:hypothetical protein